MASWNSVAASIVPSANRFAAAAEAASAEALSDGAWIGTGRGQYRPR